MWSSVMRQHGAALIRQAVLLLLVLLLAGGCAVTSTTVNDEEVVTNRKPISSYTGIVIRDFSLSSDLGVDSAAAGLSERDKRYAMAPSVLSEHIERYVKSYRIFQSIRRNDEPGPSTLVLKGAFTRIGRFRISVTVQLIDGTDGHEVAYFRHTLWDVLDTMESLNLLGRDVADFVSRIQYK